MLYPIKVIDEADGTGCALWEKALKPFWSLEFDDLTLKRLKPLLDKSFSQIILSGGTITIWRQ